MVVILTLELTGIPELSADREFPWPKPAFIDRQTRSALQMFEVRNAIFKFSNTFNFGLITGLQVSVFESGHAEYIIPEQLYLWRLKSLEDALRRRANDPCGLKVLATYVPQDKGEDPGFAEYDAEIIRYSEADEVGDEQLNKSAFESLLISWVDGDDHSEEPLSPWEVTLPDQTFNTPSPPPLVLSEKRAVAKALRTLEHDDAFKAFLGPVDIRRYPDYLARVEVPMDIGMIKERLGQDYYVSTLSVLSDIKLIRDNCLKYNGPDEIGLLAVQLHVNFREILKEELANLGVAACIISELDVDTDVVIRPNHELPPSEHQGPRTRSSGAAAVSSLELLPPPESLPAVRSTRTTARNSPTLETPAVSRRGRAPARSEQTSTSAGRSANGGDEIDHNGSTSRATRHSLRTSGGGVNPDSRGAPNRENGNSALSTRSTHSTRGRRQGDEVNNQDHIRQAERSSRPLRSERSKQRILYDQDDDDDDDGDIEEEYEVESKDGGHAESDDFSAEEDEEMDDEDEEDDAVQLNSSRRTRRASGHRRSVLEAALNSNSPRRQSPRSKAAAKYQDEESDIDMREEVAELKTATRKRTRNNTQAVGAKQSPRRRQVLKTKGKSKNHYVDSEDFEEESANSGRGGTRTRKTSSPPSRRQRQTRSSRGYQEEDSDVDDTDHHFDEEDEEEVPTPKLRKSAKGQKGPASGSRPSRRSRASKSTRYEELDSEELEESDSEEVVESDSDEDLVSSRSRSRAGGRGSSKRSADVKGKIDEPATKRTRVTAHSKQTQLPELARWPQVPLKKITAVAEGVLEKMRVLDSEKGAFEIPVAEAFPEIETAYLRAVTSPMDFRTIEEERLPTYESISQLQDDLILVFGNCVRFNGNDTEYGRYAIMMLEQLADVFQSVCHENRVRIPAGWNHL